MNPVIEQQAKRYDDLVKGLEDAHTPEACNGFAIVMKDSVICLLQGSKLQMLHSSTFNCWHSATIIGVALGIMMTAIRIGGW